MKRTIFFFIAFSLLLVFHIHAEEIRTWTSSDGKQKMEAVLIKQSENGQIVTLRKTDGKEGNVPLEKLSKEDQEYIQSIREKAGIMTVSKEKKNADEKSESKVTKENFVRYEDDGTVVIRSKNGGEQKNHISQLTQDDMNCIIECELKNFTSEKYFSPEQIKEQIEAYFKAYPIKPEEKTEWVEDEGMEQIKKRNKVKELEHQAKIKEYEKLKAESKKRLDAIDKRLQTLWAKYISAKTTKQQNQIDKQIEQENAKRDKESKLGLNIEYPRAPSKEMEYLPQKKVKRSIDRSLTPYEKNSLTLALLKLQEVLGQKYDERLFKDIMEDISSKKSLYKVDTYVAMDVMDFCLLRAARYELGARIDTFNLSEKWTRDMIKEGTATNRELGNLASAEQSRHETASNKRKRIEQDIAAIMPYCHKFSAFKHQKEESERLEKYEENRRKEEYKQQSKDLFK